MKYSVGSPIVQSHAQTLMNRLSDFSEGADGKPELWQVGQLVCLCEPAYGAHNPVGSVGFVYVVDTEDPDNPYVGIMMESGEDLNLIDALHVHDSFINLGREIFNYEFFTCQILMSDQEKGLFLPLYQAAQRLLNNGEI